jgi:hypothetical protein
MHCPFVFLFAHFSMRCCNQRCKKFFLPGKGSSPTAASRCPVTKTPPLTFVVVVVAVALWWVVVAVAVAVAVVWQRQACWRWRGQ